MSSIRRLVINMSVISLVLGLSLAATFWFGQKYTGWLLESVPNSLTFKQSWQTQLNELNELKHPAIVHLLPDDCLCRMFSLKHAQQVTQTASDNGFNVFQLGSADAGLGTPVAQTLALENRLAPLVAITRADGSLAYLGAYSDGIRCNTGTSMIESFIISPETLPKQAVIGLDVESCRCVD